MALSVLGGALLPLPGTAPSPRGPSLCPSGGRNWGEMLQGPGRVDNQGLAPRSSGGVAVTLKPPTSPVFGLGVRAPHGRGRSLRAKHPPQNKNSYFCVTTGIAALCRMRLDKHNIFPSPPAALAVKVYADIVTF